MTDINKSNTNKERCNNLLKEALVILLDTKSLSSVEWDALSLVVFFYKGERTCNGFVYTGDGEDYESWSPGSIPFTGKMKEFQEAMIEGGDRPWASALIQITKPDLNFTIDLEYDEPLRWKPHGKSLGLKAYANLLRPRKK